MSSGIENNPVNFIINGALPIGADLNDYKHIGIWHLYAERNYSNAPTTFGLLIVLHHNVPQVACYQIVIAANNLYTRYYYADDTGWRSWRTYTPTV